APRPLIGAWYREMNRYSHLPTFAAVALGATLLAQGARAGTGFDGNWSVLVVTESGSCDAAYRYGVTVEDGAVHYRGESGIDLSGRVRVAIGRGEQSAEGTGRLTAEGGSGTWSGRSATNRCTGRWQAERR